jgi:thioredoxin 1
MQSFGEIIGSSVPVIVDFHAEWCAPCKMMTPILRQVKSSLGDKVRILKIDVDKNPQLASKNSIRSVPTIKVYQNGRERWSASGVVQADQLERIVTGLRQ